MGSIIGCIKNLSHSSTKSCLFLNVDLNPILCDAGKISGSSFLCFYCT